MANVLNVTFTQQTSKGIFGSRFASGWDHISKNLYDLMVIIEIGSKWCLGISILLEMEILTKGLV